MKRDDVSSVWSRIKRDIERSSRRNWPLRTKGWSPITDEWNDEQSGTSTGNDK
jgi:hypothetical protein